MNAKGRSAGRFQVPKYPALLRTRSTTQPQLFRIQAAICEMPTGEKISLRRTRQNLLVLFGDGITNV